MGAFDPAGSYPAGVFPTTISAASLAKYPVALRYDGASKDYPLDPGGTGQYLSVHPVDQRVALRLCVQYGKIKSVPTLGSRFHLIKLDRRAQAAAVDEVHRCLDDEVTAKNIRILGIDPKVNLAAGSLVVGVDYYNLRAIDPNSIKSASNLPTFQTNS